MEKTIKNKVLASVCACGLVMSMGATALLGGVQSASAAETNSTEVTIEANPDASQLIWTAPTAINFVANADGTLVGPDADATQITNGSAFPIHITDVSVAAENGWNIVESVDANTTDNDVLNFELAVGGSTVKASEALSGKDVSTLAAYNMAAKGVTGDALDITSTGKVARLTQDIQTAKKAATVTWTVAVGNCD